ncbi:type II secretion system protein [Sulfurimonas lithotrophica]|uniref:Type II secretion system protein n=1 Tax=Sulfurimonas lithotrophica TaxID=2590022 RepID=A0A5P8P2C9_9BACT|nr:type II secretion system protein [Sulfurimonas lithotrophica]QFR49888.1 type II secretion system protein [Sulfurimonas lithotrophica]
MVVPYTKRFAFSMIELIFAIVIIGITVASVPIMTNAVGEGVKNNLVQEAIFAASAEINQVLSYRWDENSINEAVDVNATGLAKVINIAVDCNASTKLRPGHINQALHRRCLDDTTTGISAFGSDAGDLDDIDDNIVTNEDLFINDTSSDAYKNEYKYDVNVTASNINGLYAKRVTVTIYNTSGDTITSLNSYTFNIGEVDYYKRLHQ